MILSGEQKFPARVTGIIVDEMEIQWVILWGKWWVWFWTSWVCDLYVLQWVWWLDIQVERAVLEKQVCTLDRVHLSGFENGWHIKRKGAEKSARMWPFLLVNLLQKHQDTDGSLQLNQPSTASFLFFLQKNTDISCFVFSTPGKYT